MAILASLPNHNLFSSLPPTSTTSPTPSSSSFAPPIPIPKYPPPKQKHPSLSKIPHNKTKYFKPISPATPTVIPSSSADEERAVVIGESGVSYLLPGAPFEFKFSYSETPKAKALAIREPAFLPFAPPSMPRPWTGKAPLLSKKEKLLKKKKIPLFDSFNPAPPALKRLAMPKSTKLGEFFMDARTRDEILGEPLSRAEVKAFVKPLLNDNRQVNLGAASRLWTRKQVRRLGLSEEFVVAQKCPSLPSNFKKGEKNLMRFVKEFASGRRLPFPPRLKPAAPSPNAQGGEAEVTSVATPSHAHRQGDSPAGTHTSQGSHPADSEQTGESAPLVHRRKRNRETPGTVSMVDLEAEVETPEAKRPSHDVPGTSLLEENVEFHCTAGDSVDVSGLLSDSGTVLADRLTQSITTTSNQVIQYIQRTFKVLQASAELAILSRLSDEELTVTPGAPPPDRLAMVERDVTLITGLRDKLTKQESDLEEAKGQAMQWKLQGEKAVREASKLEVELQESRLAVECATTSLAEMEHFKKKAADLEEELSKVNSDFKQAQTGWQDEKDAILKEAEAATDLSFENGATSSLELDYGVIKETFPVFDEDAFRNLYAAKNEALAAGAPKELAGPSRDVPDA